MTSCLLGPLALLRRALPPKITKIGGMLLILVFALCARVLRVSSFRLAMSRLTARVIGRRRRPHAAGPENKRAKREN